MDSAQSIANTLAKYLLQIKAIKLNPVRPFTWASGLKAPIYCDNRLLLSFPEIRSFVKNSLVSRIKQNFPDVEAIAGVATAGIPHGVLVAEEMKIPFFYVRPEAKKHGMGNRIEGVMVRGQKIVVVEDLISTGMSSYSVVDAIREEGGVVKGLAAVFSYGFPEAEKKFSKARCPLVTLSNYDVLIELALLLTYIKPEHKDTLTNWKLDPQAWSEKQIPI